MFGIKISKKSTFIYLGVIGAIGLVLRLLYFDKLTFGYDQARDAFEALSIWRGDPIKVIGPTTDIRGLFHGPLYWYLISPFYHFSSGNPLLPRILMILINFINIFLIFFFAKKMFKNNFIALLSAFFFAVSYEAIQYSRWLSNPPPAIFAIALFFYGLWLVLSGVPLGLPLMIFAWSLSVNFQFFLVYQGIFLAFAFIYLYLKQKEKLIINIRKQYKYYLLSFLFFSPFILSEIKFKLQGLRAIISVIDTKTNTNAPITTKIIKFVNSLIQNISYNFTVHNLFLAKIILFIIIVWLIYSWINKYRFRKQFTFLFIWLMSPVIIYPLEKNNSYFLNIGITYPLVMMISLGLYEITEKFKFFKHLIIFGCLIIVFLTNYYLLSLNGYKGDMLFSVQDRQLLRDEYAVINYTYQASGGKQFAINSVTNPLFINTTWSYLYNFYGKKKFGCMPTWLGYPQDGTFGSEIVYTDMKERRGNLLYLIIEPGPGMPENYVKAFQQYEDVRSRLLETKKFGNLLVEKRILTNERNFSRDDLMMYVK